MPRQERWEDFCLSLRHHLAKVADGEQARVKVGNPARKQRRELHEVCRMLVRPVEQIDPIDASAPRGAP